MADKDLRSQSFEDLVNNVQGFTAMASKSQVQSVAALAARCTIEMSDRFNELSETVLTAKKALVVGVETLTAELKKSREALEHASAESANHTQALVGWTKALVLFTALYTLITGGLLAATLFK